MSKINNDAKIIAEILGLVMEIAKDTGATYDIEENNSKNYYCLKFKVGLVSEFSTFVIWYWDDENFDANELRADLKEAKEKIESFKSLNL